MERIKTQTLGCKVNYADTQALIAGLPRQTGSRVEIIATCCVTAEGEKQSRKEVRRAMKRVGGDGAVFVTGCAAKLSPGTFEGLGANVSVVTDPADAAARKISKAITTDETSQDTEVETDVLDDRTRFFLKIQDGCANMCSYCVVPLVRGRPASVPQEEVMSLARSRVEDGFAELVVSGIDLGAYNGGTDLAGLLGKLAQIEGLKRLRLSSLEAVSLSCELLETIAAHEIIGRHLHLPLQSGDDRVLAAMKRRYRNEDFLSKVELARSIIPGINITTDIMVGFPNEDDEAFLSTLQLIEEAGFSHVHVFPFSPRPGTRAWEMSDHVNSQVKRERSQVVRELSERRQLAHREGKLGRLSEVLLESGGRHGRPRGYSSDYTRFSVDQGREGSVVRVMGESITQEAVFGRVVTDEQS